MDQADPGTTTAQSNEEKAQRVDLEWMQFIQTHQDFILALIHPYLLNLQYDPYRMDIFKMLREECIEKITWLECRNWLKKNVEGGID